MLKFQKTDTNTTLESTQIELSNKAEIDLFGGDTINEILSGNSLHIIDNIANVYTNIDHFNILVDTENTNRFMYLGSYIDFKSCRSQIYHDSLTNTILIMNQPRDVYIKETRKPSIRIIPNINKPSVRPDEIKVTLLRTPDTGNTIVNDTSLEIQTKLQLLQIVTFEYTPDVESYTRYARMEINSSGIENTVIPYPQLVRDIVFIKGY